MTRHTRGVDTLGDLGEIPLPGAIFWELLGDLGESPLLAKRKNCQGFSDFETLVDIFAAQFLMETSGADRASRAEPESMLSFLVLCFYPELWGFEICDPVFDL